MRDLKIFGGSSSAKKRSFIYCDIRPTADNAHFSKVKTQHHKTLHSLQTMMEPSLTTHNSQHSLAMRSKGMRNGMLLWMERTDFCTAFPAMLAVS